MNKVKCIMRNEVRRRSEHVLNNSLNMQVKFKNEVIELMRISERDMRELKKNHSEYIGVPCYFCEETNEVWPNLSSESEEYCVIT